MNNHISKLDFTPIYHRQIEDGVWTPIISKLPIKVGFELVHQEAERLETAGHTIHYLDVEGTSFSPPFMENIQPSKN